jgi:hypothetical protein
LPGRREIDMSGTPRTIALRAISVLALIAGLLASSSSAATAETGKKA